MMRLLIAERGSRNKKSAALILLGASLTYLSYFAPSIRADDTLSSSGILFLRGVHALDSGSVEEDPDLAGRLKVDASAASWRFHSWVEGGWDGAVQRSARDDRLFKNYHDVYQSNTPFIEIKELYGEYSGTSIDLRAGIQRFAWGRLDEYAPNDLLNPWDYTRFLRKPLEDRKIGVTSISAGMNTGDWTTDVVWVLVLVPYRLPLPDERWSGTTALSTFSRSIPNSEVVPREPLLPPRTFENGSAGLRIRHARDVEWSLNLFHGWDPRPAFRSTSFLMTPSSDKIIIDPGYTPSFHKISVVGLDAAAVKGDWSIRAEAAYTFGRYFIIRSELWGYPAAPFPGVPYALNSIERKSDTVDYGIGADYRVAEDVLLLLQAQQTVIFDRQDSFYEKKVETVLWANLKAGWMNQKVETNMNIAYNPEHRDRMSRANAWYLFTDSWKAGITAIAFSGPRQSLFGRYSRNDQVEAEVVYSW